MGIKSGVYQIFNNRSGIRYIGSSLNVYQRIRAHRSLLKRNKHSNKYLQRSWNKNGPDAFEFLIIILTKDQLIEIEQYYIDL